MNEKGAVLFRQPADLTDPSKEQPVTPIQANAYSASVSHANYSQTGNTIRAFTEVGMTYQYIANALVSIGEKVETIKTNAAVATNVTVNSGQVIEDANRIRGIQNRGEEITVTPRLNYPSSTTAAELVTTSQVTNLKPEQKVSVVEGIEVTQQTPASNQNNIPDQMRFIQPLTDADLKK